MSVAGFVAIVDVARCFGAAVRKEILFLRAKRPLEGIARARPRKSWETTATPLPAFAPGRVKVKPTECFAETNFDLNC